MLQLLDGIRKCRWRGLNDGIRTVCGLPDPVPRSIIGIRCYDSLFKQNDQDFYNMLIILNLNLIKVYVLKEEFRLSNQSYSFDDMPRHLEELVLHFE